MTRIKQNSILVCSLMFESNWLLTTGPELWNATLISHQRLHALRPAFSVHRSLKKQWTCALHSLLGRSAAATGLCRYRV